ncbi:methyltransferase domain-containing protein [Pontixanthobacter sp.]|uniref:methyltransferase domain-containing protein n=1 Tax=Pontixanthobacter sp. TaxID=2792078 RepID=UPI003C79A563
MISFLISKAKQKYPPLFLAVQLFRNRVGSTNETLEEIHLKYRNPQNQSDVALDLGCGKAPRNLFHAKTVYGADLQEDIASNVLEVNLGYQRLPFEDASIDYITAYDLLEHIPRHSESRENGRAPFIFLMNEIWRILRYDGVFLSVTPIYPYMAAFQDPTHNNIITSDTFELYFCREKYAIANHYGIKTNFTMLYKKMQGQHLVAALKK